MGMRSPLLDRIRQAGCAVTLSGLLVAAGADASAEARFLPRAERQATSAVDWIASGRDFAAYGAGREIRVRSLREEAVAAAAPLLPAGVRVRDARVAAELLFLATEDGEGHRLRALDLTSGVGFDVPLRPSVRGSLRLERMDDFLLVHEEGYGLRVLALAAHHPHAMSGHSEEPVPTEVGVFRHDVPLLALAAAGRRVHLVEPDGITVVDARVARAPSLLRRIPLHVAAGVRAAAANGSTLLLLGDEGLDVVDLSGRAPRPAVERHPEVRGRSLAYAGRRLEIAGDDGWTTYDDRLLGGMTFFVQVGDTFFNPAGTINVQTGDTVEWQKGTTLGSHNVFSCTAAQSGCNAQDATETFTSGTPTTAPFIFSHQFTIVGDNPYVCQVHFFSMTGNISVAGAAPAPPAVPDGSGGLAPMRAGKLAPGGLDLSVTWEDACSGAGAHHLLHGSAAGLPAIQGGVYALSGSSCSLGASPFAWEATPQPAAGDFLWWLIVAEDGSGLEGSWGADGQGGERDGAGTGGSSAQCGVTDKDPSAGCMP